MKYTLEHINGLIHQFEDEQKDLLFINNYKEDELPRKYWLNQGALTILKDLKNDYLVNQLQEKEEKKIPEKLEIQDDGNTITLFGEKENEWTILDNVDILICNKINSIIDYLKSKGE